MFDGYISKNSIVINGSPGSGKSYLINILVSIC
jgi:DNA replication protein DnaC